MGNTNQFYLSSIIGACAALALSVSLAQGESPVQSPMLMSDATRAHLGEVSQNFPSWVARPDTKIIAISYADFYNFNDITDEKTLRILSSLTGIDMTSTQELNLIAQSINHVIRTNITLALPATHQKQNFCFLVAGTYPDPYDFVSELTGIPASLIEKVPGNNLSWMFTVYRHEAAHCKKNAQFNMGLVSFTDKLEPELYADQTMVNFIPLDIQMLGNPDLQDMSRPFMMMRALKSVHSKGILSRNYRTAASVFFPEEPYIAKYQDSLFVHKATENLLDKLYAETAKQKNSFTDLPICEESETTKTLFAQMSCGEDIKTQYRFDTETYILFARAALSLYNAPETSDFERRFLKLYLEGVQTFMPSIAAKANIQLAVSTEPDHTGVAKPVLQ